MATCLTKVCRGQGLDLYRTPVTHVYFFFLRFGARAHSLISLSLSLSHTHTPSLSLSQAIWRLRVPFQKGSFQAMRRAFADCVRSRDWPRHLGGMRREGGSGGERMRRNWANVRVLCCPPCVHHWCFCFLNFFYLDLSMEYGRPGIGENYRQVVGHRDIFLGGGRRDPVVGVDRQS